MTEDKPHTRTYSGAESLPELSDNYKAVQIGRNDRGEYDPHVRSFVATVRNRSSSDMWIKEGSNSDGIRIGPQESYVVTRLDGTSRIRLKGADVGADYEIRSVEAHNDFGIRDRIEAFTQSVSALLRSNQSFTTIEAAKVALDTTITGATATLDTNITASDATLDTNIASATATLDTKIAASDVDLNTNIKSSEVTLNTDITAQSTGDVFVSRPSDQATETDQQITEREVDDVPNSADTPFNLLSQELESEKNYVLEEVSMRPRDGPLDEPWQVIVVTYNAAGNVDIRLTATYPYTMPVQFSPGIFVDGDGTIRVFLRQESGSTLEAEVQTRYREADLS